MYVVTELGMGQAYFFKNQGEERIWVSGEDKVQITICIHNIGIPTIFNIGNHSSSIYFAVLLLFLIYDKPEAWLVR